MKKQKTILKHFKKMHVYQLENKNQFIIEGDGCKCFQSYNSLVAIYDTINHSLLLGRDWDYSNTTRKHLYIFICDYCYLPSIENVLCGCKNKRKAIEKMIQNKTIAYDDELR